jgi:chromosome segregation ATPase
LSYQTNLSIALRRQIYDQKEEIKQKEEELFHVKRDVRNTKHMEYEAENNILMNECVRLRAIIDQLFGQMGPDALKEANAAVGAHRTDGSTPQRRERSKDDMIQNLLQANEQFQKVDQDKDHKIIELQDQLSDVEDRLNKKIRELQDIKRNNVKNIKNKNKELQQLKHQVDSNKHTSPLHPITETKDKSKEITTKFEKELSKVKADLKRFKDNDKKLKTQINELEQEKKENIYENKELKRKVNAYETKIELLKKRESEPERTPDDKSSISIKESQKHNIKPNPYSNDASINDGYSNEIPVMKPIIAPDSDDENNKNNYDYEMDSESDGQNDNYHKRDESKEGVHTEPEIVHTDPKHVHIDPEIVHTDHEIVDTEPELIY